jgi:hypothetical protein
MPEIVAQFMVARGHVPRNSYQNTVDAAAVRHGKGGNGQGAKKPLDFEAS